jgi:hypothetical protein
MFELFQVTVRPSNAALVAILLGPAFRVSERTLIASGRGRGKWAKRFFHFFERNDRIALNKYIVNEFLGTRGRSSAIGPRPVPDRSPVAASQVAMDEPVGRAQGSQMGGEGTVNALLYQWRQGKYRNWMSIRIRIRVRDVRRVRRVRAAEEIRLASRNRSDQCSSRQL